MSNHTVRTNVHGHHQPGSFRGANAWRVRAGGNVVGPVSIDLIERGLLAGKIPGDAEMAHLDRNEWQRVNEIFAIARRAPQHRELPPVPPPPPSFRYPEEPVSIPKQGLLASIFG